MEVCFIGGGNQSTQIKPTLRSATGQWQTLSHNIVSSEPWVGFELTTLMVIGTDCTGSYKSNYHTTTTPTVPISFVDEYTLKKIKSIFIAIRKRNGQMLKTWRANATNYLRPRIKIAT